MLTQRITTSPDTSPAGADEVGALFGALASPRSTTDTLTLDEVGELFDKSPPKSFTDADERVIVRDHPRRTYPYQKCPECEQRTALLSAWCEATGRYRTACPWCWHPETAPDEFRRGQLEMRFS